MQTISESLYIHTFTSRESAYARSPKNRVVRSTVCSYVNYISRRRREKRRRSPSIITFTRIKIEMCAEREKERERDRNKEKIS